MHNGRNQPNLEIYWKLDKVAKFVNCSCSVYLYKLCYTICIFPCFYQARSVWFYCTDKVYCYQLILKSVLFYTLMEYCALVNEILLMMSGDIESNPGPSEYLYRSISPVPLDIPGSPLSFSADVLQLSAENCS